MENSKIDIKFYLNTIKDWYNYLFSYKKTLILISFIGSVIGFSYSLLNKPIYVAKLSFALEEDSGSALTGALALAGSFGLDIGQDGGGAFAGTNILDLISSRSVIEKSLLRPDPKNINQPLIKRYLEIGQNKKLKTSNDIVFQVNEDINNLGRKKDSITQLIYNSFILGDLKVAQENPKSSIITITVKSQDQIFAKNFSIALSKTVSELYTQTKSGKEAKNLALIERQVDSIRAELNKSILKTAQENDKNFALNPALNINRIDFLKNQVDLQANTAILTELVKNLEIARASLRKKTPLIQVLDSPKIPLPKIYFRKLKGIIYGGIFFGLIGVCSLFAIRYIKQNYIVW